MIEVKVRQNPKNNICVDCGQDCVTYFIVNLAVFVCEKCAFQHWQHFPLQKHYLKELDTEVFDPYQTQMLVNVSCNETFRKLMLEYKIQRLHMQERYKMPIVDWHKRKVKHMCLGAKFTAEQPKMEMKINKSVNEAEVELNKMGTKIAKGF